MQPQVPQQMGGYQQIPQQQPQQPQQMPAMAGMPMVQAGGIQQLPGNQQQVYQQVPQGGFNFNPQMLAGLNVRAQ
jgi:hypothetical protein